ncbi:MAG TPA: redoxin domain-containing protein [Anaerolineales bacterium]|nr:redoxin domain-containing protein [Anaerolineales bacterium]
MKRLIVGLFVLVLIGCSTMKNTAQQIESSVSKASTLPDLGPAPELANEIWLNTEGPLRLADLRGKVVLLEMWTFGCYNCQNVMPSLKEWHSKYKDQGLVIIGNHYPEFSYEADLENLKQSIQRYEIEYAVAQDNDGATWRAYQNRYWPALFLIDKEGHIRYVHIGEGRYKETEENIKALLEENY